MKANMNQTCMPLLLSILILVLISCGGDTQVSNSPIRLPLLTSTITVPAATPTATLIPVPTVFPASSPLITKTATVIPTKKPPLADVATKKAPLADVATKKAPIADMATKKPPLVDMATKKPPLADVAAPTVVPAISDTVRFQIDVQEVATSSQLDLTGIGGPSLIRTKDGRYRLYLHSRTHEGDRNIISLISTDGSKWEVEPGIRIPRGSDSALDSEAGEPGVYLGSEDKYYMAYTGRFMGINSEGAEEKMHRVVFAVSDDGLTWSKLNQHYADSQSRNDFASSADVNFIDGEYVMYYTGGTFVIRATSLDGLTWVRQDIVFWGHDSTTVKYGDEWYMFARMPKQLKYSKNFKLEDERLVMLVSRDGVNWSKNYYQVIVENEDGSEVAVEESKNPAAVLLLDGSLRVFLQTRHGERIYSIKPMEPLPTLGMETTSE